MESDEKCFRDGLMHQSIEATQAISTIAVIELLKNNGRNLHASFTLG